MSREKLIKTVAIACLCLREITLLLKLITAEINTLAARDVDAPHNGC